MELYDVLKDPKELNNLVREELGIVKEYHTRRIEHKKFIRKFEIKTSVRKRDLGI